VEDAESQRVVVVVWAGPVRDTDQPEWCPHWDRHPSASQRLTAPWHAYEALRRNKGTGLSTGWMHHADRHHAALTTPRGAFARSGPGRHPPAPDAGRCAGQSGCGLGGGGFQPLVGCPRYLRGRGRAVTPKTRYAKTGGGVSIAYQVVGDGPFDLVLVPGFAPMSSTTGRCRPWSAPWGASPPSPV
jgi:hypothetical protein